jgi:hypothetical protein
MESRTRQKRGPCAHRGDGSARRIGRALALLSSWLESTVIVPEAVMALESVGDSSCDQTRSPHAGQFAWQGAEALRRYCNAMDDAWSKRAETAGRVRMSDGSILSSSRR